MDLKQMIVGMTLILAVSLGWQAFVRYQYSIHPNWIRPGQETASPTPGPAGSTPGGSTMPVAVAPSTGPAVASATTQSVGPWHFVSAGSAPGQSSLIGSTSFEDPAYHLGLNISPNGAGLDSVVLNQYRQEVDSPDLFIFQTPYAADISGTRPLATTAVVIDGTEIPTSAAVWNVESKTDHSITYSADLQGADGSIHIEKQFVLDPATSDNDQKTSQGYEVEVNYSIINQSSQAHRVALQFNGPTEPRAETARQETEVVAAYDDTDSHVTISHQPLSYFGTSSPSKDFVVNDDKYKLVWVGATSNYFNAIVRPGQEGQFASAVAAAMNPASLAPDRLVNIHLTTTDINLAAGATSKIPLQVFFGPKRRNLLGTTYYSSFPVQYDKTLVLIATGILSGICGLCTFPWLISFLVAVLRVLHFVLNDWGLAIIALVCGVRFLLHPITKKSQVSMMSMQKLAPEMERLKKKFGDDKEGFQKAQMGLYKDVGFTPILGCLPMFLQMPIFIALWRALQTTFELRQAPFLRFFGIHFTWIKDLSQPDYLVKFHTPVALPIVGWMMYGINALPIAMAVVTYINQKYFTPRPMTLTPEQEQQQKMMTMMMPFMLLMFYTFPSGLNLYYLTSTSLGIIESKIIRNHIKRADEAQKGLGPVIIDAGKPTRAARRRLEQEDETPKKKGFLQRLQEKAEEMQRQAEQAKKKK
jgi:YidC/Oxa1 family membrane protein insertase